MRLQDFALERFFARWEFKAELLLCASDVEGWAMRDLLELASEDDRRRWDDLRLGYTDSAGQPALRDAIAKLYERVSPDEVLVFAGAEEAIFTLHNVLVGPGDHAVVVRPAYQSLSEVARATGAEVTRVELRETSGWRLDPEEVRAALRPNTRLILINEPHNPTGSLMDRPTFDRLIELAAEAGARLVVDEVYRFLEFDPADQLPAGADALPRGVSIGVIASAAVAPADLTSGAAEARLSIPPGSAPSFDGAGLEITYVIRVLVDRRFRTDAAIERPVGIV
jgi:Aminotransferase class I and II